MRNFFVRPSVPGRNFAGRCLTGIGLLLVAATIAGCAQQPSGGGVRRSATKEYFPEGRYGRASQRVVADGEAVPRGGGQYLVGRSYTIAGRRYVPREMAPGQSQSGMASWYGDAFHGRKTANGEVYDMSSVSAAHPTMPLPSYARVTNTRNGRSIIVRVNDRGPFHAGRVMDVSKRVADALDFRRAGTGQVKVDYLGPAGLGGSDDQQLMATLTEDGRPASLPGMPTMAPTTMLAQNEAPEPVAYAPPPRAPAPAPVEIPRAMAVAGPSPRSEAPAERSAALPTTTPLPPSRPFDLGTIPGADVPIIATKRLQSASASFYAQPSKVTSTLIKRHPFDGVDTQGLQSLIRREVVSGR
ncbi:MULTISPECIES: septal ring lytic transglycosylase RlpA family protein [unclassified Beijerinckia]|uniref:septal ring lytic transglycosylase RlpA family protein n=1 Tax=unclassified Beijerinckia TaxID=2638183 RepID=UPI001FCDDB83|nr:MULTISPECIES: septal ring lytic transglycosylase RlpA family protein [unclassified Beijerinckia]